MKQVGVWIDLSQAIIVTIKGDQKTMKKIAGVDSQQRIPGEGKTFTRFGNQFSNLERQKESKLAHLTKVFLKSVIDQISHCDELVIFGPARMKNELADLVITNKSLSQKLKGVFSADSMTDRQTIAWVDEYFSKQFIDLL